MQCIVMSVRSNKAALLLFQECEASSLLFENPLRCALLFTRKHQTSKGRSVVWRSTPVLARVAEANVEQ